MGEHRVASIEECQAALDRLAAHLAVNAAEVRRKANLDRTIACRVTDLGVSFRGRLRNGDLVEVAEGDDPDAKIVLSAKSDDLIALIDGDLDFARALAGRRVAINAHPLDLMRLYRML